MKRRTLEWVQKAEGDWAAGQRELAVPEAAYHVVCFLAQQCAELYLKAFLEEQQTPFEKKHDLGALLDLARGAFPELILLRSRLAELGAFGIAVRYPGPVADRRTAEDSMAVAEAVRAAVRTRLGLSEGNEQGVPA